MNIELLKTFCRLNDPFRPYFESPLSDSKWTYASDGYVAIRVPRMPEITSDSAQIPALPKLFEEYPLPTDESGWVLPFTCDGCKGTGEWTCPTCNAVHACDMCEGEGFEAAVGPAFRQDEGKTYLSIGCQWFDVKYLRQIARLPKLRVYPCNDAAKELSQPLRFSFDGGSGLLMSVRMSKDAETDQIRGDMAGKRD